MAIFAQGNNSCYFVHIPRTGGRYVTSVFENSENVQCMHHKINQERIEGIDITHLHYPLYNDYLGVNDIPHIAVVRNPYTKFISCIRNMHSIHGIDYNDLMKNEEEFLKFISIEINYQSRHNNWFLPQHVLVSPKTFIWKYEWGFGNNFRNWVYKKTKIKLEDKKVFYDKFVGETEIKYQPDRIIKKYVRKFYKQDYRKFGYFL
jgi:hypothetical protein